MAGEFSTIARRNTSATRTWDELTLPWYNATKDTTRLWAVLDLFRTGVAVPNMIFYKIMFGGNKARQNYVSK
jgi:hypothetical protein